MHCIPGAYIKFEYLNHRGEKAVRHVEVKCFTYGAFTEFGYMEPQWFLTCKDLDKTVARSFAVANMTPGTIMEMSETDWVNIGLEPPFAPTGPLSQ